MNPKDFREMIPFIFFCKTIIKLTNHENYKRHQPIIERGSVGKRCSHVKVKLDIPVLLATQLADREGTRVCTCWTLTASKDRSVITVSNEASDSLAHACGCVPASSHSTMRHLIRWYVFFPSLPPSHKLQVKEDSCTALPLIIRHRHSIRLLVPP